MYIGLVFYYIHACMHACLENLASLFYHRYYTIVSIVSMVLHSFLPLASLLHLFSVLAGYSYLYSLLCMSTFKPSLPTYSLL